MTDYCPAHRTGCRSDRPAGSRSAGYLTGFSLSRCRSGRLGTIRTLGNILGSARFPDLLPMWIGIENRLGGRTSGQEESGKHNGSESLHAHLLKRNGGTRVVYRPYRPPVSSLRTNPRIMDGSL